VVVEVSIGGMTVVEVSAAVEVPELWTGGEMVVEVSTGGEDVVGVSMEVDVEVSTGGTTAVEVSMDEDSDVGTTVAFGEDSVEVGTTVVSGVTDEGIDSVDDAAELTTELEGTVEGIGATEEPTDDDPATLDGITEVVIEGDAEAEGETDVDDSTAEVEVPLEVAAMELEAMGKGEGDGTSERSVELQVDDSNEEGKTEEGPVMDEASKVPLLPKADVDGASDEVALGDCDPARSGGPLIVADDEGPSVEGMSVAESEVEGVSDTVIPNEADNEAVIEGAASVDVTLEEGTSAVEDTAGDEGATDATEEGSTTVDVGKGDGTPLDGAGKALGDVVDETAVEEGVALPMMTPAEKV
jgi:hypothetical protein